MITEKKYKVDDKNLSAQELQEYFSSTKQERRQRITLELVSKLSRTVLDLGCYSGHIVSEGIKLYPDKIFEGADYLEEHLEMARVLHPNLKNDCFKLLNTYDLSSVKGRYDTILFQEVIEHLEGAANAIKEINHALKTGGELILSTPTAYYWKDAFQAFKYETIRRFRKKNLPLSDSIYFKEHEWNRHIYCWTPSTLYTLLKVNGFEYVTHKYCQSSGNILEKLFLKMFPFASPTIIMKVKKVADAPKALI